MQETNLTAKTIYRPIPFLLSVFSITWLCAFLMTIADYNAHPVLFTVLDFLENASPLICAFVLLKKPLSSMPSLFRFLLGKAGHPAFYLIVLFLFAAQFFNFYCFQVEAAELSVQTFALTCAGQILL